MSLAILSLTAAASIAAATMPIAVQVEKHGAANDAVDAVDAVASRQVVETDGVGNAGDAGDDEAPLPPTFRHGEPIRFYQIQVQEGFWRAILDRNRDATLPAIWNVTERSGRFRNFEAVGSRRGGTHRGRAHDDADVYMLLEAAAWTVADRDDPRLLDRLDRAERRVAAAQRSNGYLGTWQTLRGAEHELADVATSAELLNFGHLLEAAAARYEVDGGRTLYQAALRATRLLEREFGPDGRTEVGPAPQVELGLLRMHELTGEESFAQLAEWFVSERRMADGRTLRDQEVVVGEAMGMLRLFTAAAGLARLTADDELIAVLARLWDDLQANRLRIDGGVVAAAAADGPSQAGAEGDARLAEVGASFALVNWAHRMNLLTFDARYVDVMERALFNAILSSVAQDGTNFFGALALDSHGASRRAPWFEAVSGPADLARLLASFRDRLFIKTRGTQSLNTVYVNHYLTGEMSTSFGRNTVRLVQRTDYPWDGRVQFWIAGGRMHPYRVALRIPDWAESFRIVRDGETLEVPVERGYAILEGPSGTDTTFDLHLDMPVRTIASERVGGPAGHVALARGPLIYCVERVDAAPDLRQLSFDPTQEFRLASHDASDDPLHGLRTIEGTATRTLDDGSTEAVPFRAVPYFAWANREPGAMRTWLPTSRDLADRRPIPGIVPSASVRSDIDPLVALHDGLAPDPNDPASWAAPRPRFTWWPQRGSWEWVVLDFEAPRKVAAVELYWVDDLAQGGIVTLPRTVRLLRRDGPEWLPVAEVPLSPEGRSVPHGHLLRIELPDVSTGALRVEAHLAEGYGAGLFEWRIVEATP